MKTLRILFGWLGSFMGLFAIVGAFAWIARKVSVFFRAIH